MDNSIRNELNPAKTISVKTAVIIAVIIVIAALGYAYKGVFVAATVNGSPISRLAVIQELESASGKAVLDAILVRKLIDDEMDKRGLAVTDSEISVEIKNIEERVESQGTTLDQALADQNMTRIILEKQIATQKKLGKLLADKIQVTDEEAEQFISDNQITVPEGQESAYMNNLKEQLWQQKMNNEANLFVDSLKAQAKIRYFTNY